MRLNFTASSKSIVAKITLLLLFLLLTEFKHRAIQTRVTTAERVRAVAIVPLCATASWARVDDTAESVN